MAESSINMKFTAQTADAQKRIAELEKEVARLNKETKETSSASSSAATGIGGMSSSAVAAAGAIAAAVVAVKAFVSAAAECIDVYREQELAESRLQAVLKATDNQIGTSIGDLKKYASALQSVTRFGDESVLSAEKILIATQALDKDGLQRALEASADLAEAMGIDLPSAASTMAYALQDPEQGLSRLRRQGIAFTDEEIKQVKALQDANDLYGAQAVVLDKIEAKYKGVAKAVADTPTGTLDKIKNVWGDIKQGLGKGLLDTISPALETLYGKLLKISNWIEQHSDSTVAEIRTAIQGDMHTDLSGYSVTELLKAIDSATYDAQNNNDPSGFAYKIMNLFGWQKGIGTFSNVHAATVMSAIDSELRSRGYDGISGARTGLIVPSTTWSYDFGEEEASVSSAVESFIKAQGNASRRYQAAQYQATIDEAAGYMAAIEKYFHFSDGKMFFNEGQDYSTAAQVAKDLGLAEGSTYQDVKDIYFELGEIIDTTQAKKDKLFEEPAEPEEKGWSPTDYLAEYNTAVDQLKQQLSMLDKQISDTTDPATLAFLTDVRDSLQEQYEGLTELTPAVSGLNEFIQQNASLSATAQRAMLDAKIAEAEAWKASGEAGEEEIKILDELIKKWKELRNESEGAEKTWQENVKGFLGTWTPAINKFQSLTTAVVDFQTQLWDSQADELEKALERDKKTGDMSEEEEKDRLATINTLRQKSFEAEKANSIATALINGALAVTECLTEGIPGYVMAGIVAATTAVQVATISAQQYTPMAKGGIVTEATPIIAGEAGPEAIIPLSGGRGKQFLEGSGGVVINITIQGNADEEAIFHAIERAQRTGYLPNWQYA